jgi:hypothetical protein
MPVQSAFAQEKLSVNQPFTQTIAAGVTNKYPIPLNDGDYAEVSLTSQSGRVNLFVLNPDGTSMRGFGGPSGGDRDTYAFAAEGAGVYSLSIVNPGEQAASYELTLQKIVSLNASDLGNGATRIPVRAFRRFASRSPRARRTPKVFGKRSLRRVPRWSSSSMPITGW